MSIDVQRCIVLFPVWFKGSLFQVQCHVEKVHLWHTMLYFDLETMLSEDFV